MYNCPLILESHGLIKPMRGTAWRGFMSTEAIQFANHEKRRAALVSVSAAILLTVIKITVGLMTGSLGILAEAAHSGLDLAAALMTFFAVRVSSKPADREHTYGHGKVENLSALFETLLLLLTCVWIVYEAVQRLFFDACSHPDKYS